jgi:hypothetical protein
MKHIVKKEIGRLKVGLARRGPKGKTAKPKSAVVVTSDAVATRIAPDAAAPSLPVFRFGRMGG